MHTFISFLRGVNMTGHNSIKMTDLSALYQKLGFIEPETFIQSGNVIFSTDKDTKVPEIASSIETAIKNTFSYDVPVMIRTLKEMRDLFNCNPYITEINFDPAKMAVIFLHETPSESQIQKVADVDYPPDKFSIIGNEIYTFCPNGFGRTKIYTNFFENKMKVTGTARNWKTVTTLLTLAEKRFS
jgi:uncharacterized protein (DUF1697 family)